MQAYSVALGMQYAVYPPGIVRIITLEFSVYRWFLLRCSFQSETQELFQPHKNIDLSGGNLTRGSPKVVSIHESSWALLANSITLYRLTLTQKSMSVHMYIYMHI